MLKKEHNSFTIFVDILELLCQGSETESVQQLLSSTSSSSSLVQDGVLDEILTILQTKLKSWFALPYVAHWCITQVKVRAEGFFFFIWYSGYIR